MALLDLQALEAEERSANPAESTLSLLSCVSAASYTLCL